MDIHLLFELTYMFYKVRSTIIHDERWLVETSRKFRPFYSPCKGGFRDLAQCLFYNIVLYSFVRGAPTFPLVKILILTWERFAWWSSRTLPVYSILFIIGRDIRVGGVLLLFFLTELLFQIINLLLHGFLITLLMSYMTFPLKTTPVRMNIVHAAFLMIFLISLMFKIVKFILLMNVGWFRLVRLVWCSPNPIITVKLYWNTSNPHRRHQL